MPASPRPFDVVRFLRRVRDAQALEHEELTDFVKGLMSGQIADYQVSAFLMAVYLRGLDPATTAALTLAMRDAGEVLDFGEIAGPKVDKHSTGGVGDKISLVLAPLIACCGARVPMVCGRGLGHTGGTIDKLEAIPGFATELTPERCRALLDELGLFFASQGARLAPADKKLYALRDVTATVESIPLITASILAKKLAEGLDALVIDLKVGRGAFMKTEEEARALGASLLDVGQRAGLTITALLTDMDAPLGLTVGNALEVREAIAILRGEGPEDVTELTLMLGVEMLLAARAETSFVAARTRLSQALTNGEALAKFQALVAAQGGDPRVVDDPDLLPKAPVKLPVHATRSGFIFDIDAFELGLLAVELGAGRARAEDAVDPAVGFELRATRGARVKEGDEIALVHMRERDDTVAARAAATFIIADDASPPRSHIIARLR